MQLVLNPHLGQGAADQGMRIAGEDNTQKRKFFLPIYGGLPGKGPGKQMKVDRTVFEKVLAG